MRALLLFLIFSSGWVQAAADLSVQSVTIKGKTERGEILAEGQVTMPYVQAANKALAAKINDHLYIGQLGVMAPRQSGKDFGADDLVVDTLSENFSISRNDGRILTIVFENEGCGAYCETYRVIYSFDANTGRMLSIEELLAPAGMRELARRMAKESLTRYQQQLASLRKDLKTAQRNTKSAANDELLGDLNARIELNSQCAGEGSDRPRAPVTDAELAQRFRYYSHELADKQFNITAGRCSNHAQRALDDVGDIALSLSYDSLRPYLTAYGKALLLGEGTGRAPGGIYGQLLRGYLGGNIPITMRLSKAEDNSVSGTYFYDKYRKPIAVRGRAQGNELELTESAGDGGETKATLRLTASGDHLKGRWIGKKQFDVTLGP